jgi:LMBR1 domain-containing protein 1
VEANTCSYTNNTAIFVDANSTTTTSYCVMSSQTLEITVSFPIYVIAIMSFVGWFPLMIFLGAGLIALPVDLINDWRFRPRPMNEADFNRRKHELAGKVDVLLQGGKKLLE